MNAAETAESLRRDLAPGPFQEMSGWAHAIPKEKREAIVEVAGALLVRKHHRLCVSQTHSEFNRHCDCVLLMRLETDRANRAEAKAERAIDVGAIAGVLIAHTRTSGIHGDCSCGHVVPLGRSFAAHQAEAIAAHVTGGAS